MAIFSFRSKYFLFSAGCNWCFESDMTVAVCLRNNKFRYLYIWANTKFQNIRMYKFEIDRKLILWNLCSNQVGFILTIRKKIDILFDIPLSLVLYDSFSVIRYSSFSREYHVYKDRWQLTLGDHSLYFKEEKNNECDKHAVAIIYDIFHSNKVVRHVSL